VLAGIAVAAHYRTSVTREMLQGPLVFRFRCWIT
jgi:hypothetical protein